jgi:hypothetical protein
MNGQKPLLTVSAYFIRICAPTACPKDHHGHLERAEDVLSVQGGPILSRVLDGRAWP